MKANVLIEKVYFPSIFVELDALNEIIYQLTVEKIDFFCGVQMKIKIWVQLCFWCKYVPKIL